MTIAPAALAAITDKVFAYAPSTLSEDASSLDEILPGRLRSIPPAQLQKALPCLAKDRATTSEIQRLLQKVKTSHDVNLGDARTMPLGPESVHLAVTSPPYWNLKSSPDTIGQLGRLDEYDDFLRNLNMVWENCFAALVPGGRLVCVVGDVCLSRQRNGGRHTVVPLHAAIQQQCQQIGFDNLAPIIWHKISNIQTEVSHRGTYLGKPYEPNGIIKNDIEFILMFRKPGGYRRPNPSARILSLIAAEDHNKWFRQIWSDIRGASTRRHPAPFPVELAERLIRMFSFVGDTVLDPFTGTASTQVAAKACGRNSIGFEIEPGYREIAISRLS